MTRLSDIKALPVSEAVRRMNPELFGGPPVVAPKVKPLKYANEVAEELARKEQPNRRLRQDQKPVMNKLEQRFFDEKLKPDYVLKGDPVLIQAVRLELARGIWYKPDFFLPAIQGDSSCLDEGRKAIAYEVKGPKVFRGGFENLKVAARVHPWVKFFLVWEDKETGNWTRQEILP